MLWLLLPVAGGTCVPEFAADIPAGTLRVGETRSWEVPRRFRRLDGVVTVAPVRDEFLVVVDSLRYQEPLLVRLDPETGRVLARHRPQIVTRRRRDYGRGHLSHTRLIPRPDGAYVLNKYGLAAFIEIPAGSMTLVERPPVRISMEWLAAVQTDSELCWFTDYHTHGAFHCVESADHTPIQTPEWSNADNWLPNLYAAPFGVRFTVASEVGQYVDGTWLRVTPEPSVALWSAVGGQSEDEAILASVRWIGVYDLKNGSWTGPAEPCDVEGPIEQIVHAAGQEWVIYRSYRVLRWAPISR